MTETLAVWISSNLIKKLKVLAARKETSIKAIVTEIVEKYLSEQSSN